MEKTRKKRILLITAITLALGIGMSSCAGMFGSIGVGPAGPTFEISGPIGGNPGPGPGGPGPGGPGPGGPGGPF